MHISSNRAADVAAWYKAELLKIYDQAEARVIVDWVIEHHTGLSRLKAMSDPGFRFTESEILKLHFAFKRILADEPVQYVLGYGWFYGRRFAVKPGVLIPRRETEELVAWALDELAAGWEVLDVGCGSGCIGLTLKLENPSLGVTLVDVSPEALEVCRENCAIHRSGVTVLEADIFSPPDFFKEKMFNLIISNPPYVRLSEQLAMKPNVLHHEPRLALFVPDDDPLVFYRVIAQFALQHLHDGGLLMFEINEALGEAVGKLLQQTGFSDVELRRDMQHRWRMVKGKIFR